MPVYTSPAYNPMGGAPAVKTKAITFLIIIILFEYSPMFGVPASPMFYGTQPVIMIFPKLIKDS